MKKVAFIAAVVLTTMTLQSCRQSDEYISPQEAATLKRVQDTSNNLVNRNATDTTINNTNSNSIEFNQDTNTGSLVDGEIVPPPRK